MSSNVYTDDVTLVVEPGYTFTRELDYQTSAGVPIDISGYTATFMVNVGGTVHLGVATIPVGTDGKIHVSLSSGQTSQFNQWWGIWRVQLKATDGSLPPFVHGLLDVHRGR